MARQEHLPPTRVFILTIPGVDLFYAADSQEVVTLMRASTSPAVRDEAPERNRSKGQNPER
jgi:hypothetical protein